MKKKILSKIGMALILVFGLNISFTPNKASASSSIHDTKVVKVKQSKQKVIAESSSQNKDLLALSIGMATVSIAGLVGMDVRAKKKLRIPYSRENQK